MAQKKPPAAGTTPGALTHSPFARLTDDAKLARLATLAAPSVPAPPEPRKAPPPCKVRMRLESAGRSGRVVTRISGLPAANLEAIASRLRRALGCGASIEDSDVILQGSLRERASDWLDRAGDLYAIREPDKADQRVRTGPDAAVPAHPTPGAARTLSGTRRADVRRGQRVAIVLKADQASGKLTEGTVRELLTSSPSHPRGIKVRLESGEVGRVKIVY
jgi:uncharacterized repeat protein (TIGR03833 family)